MSDSRFPISKPAGTMTDIDYQLRSLRASLEQEERILAVISSTENHAEVKARVNQYKVDIAKLEAWKLNQKRVRDGVGEEITPHCYGEA